MASTAAGGVLAAGEVGEQAARVFPKAKSLGRAGKLVSLDRFGPRTRLGIGATALAGDALATHELAGNFRTARGKPRRPPNKQVQKYAPIPELTKGLLLKMRKGIQPALNALPSSEQVASGAGRLTGEATKGPKRKAGVVAASGGALAVHSARNRREPKYLADSSASPVDFGKDASFTAKGTIAKFDGDKRLVFGWANISEVNGSPVVDKQGDYIPVEHLEDAAHNYVLNTRVGGDMHRRTADGRPHHVSDLVESVVFTDEKISKMFPDQDTSHIPRGWWVGFKVWDDDAWGLVKKGARTEFSIHGKGRRTPLDVDELMGY